MYGYWIANFQEHVPEVAFFGFAHLLVCLAKTVSVAFERESVIRHWRKSSG